MNPHFGSRLPLARKIAHCEALYARYELPVLFRLTPFAHPADLAATLVARGYSEFDETFVQVLRLPVSSPPVQLADDTRLRTVSPREFVQAAAQLRNSTPTQSEAHSERLENSPLSSRLLLLEERGAIVCAAQMTAEEDVAGVFDVVTAASARGRGYGSLVVAALVEWARARGIRVVYLQVAAANAPALAVYRKFGFDTLYAYRYYGRPGEMG